ncbi:MAG: hypothetical protein QOI64_2049 [Solirubrobacteraceae bacterium]|jgi:hypothetical protein|nr:hypothetical protein [Solirubrobacteraceae bacterium]
MFYESLGIVLTQAAEVLKRDVRAEVHDERVQTQLDAVAAVAADIGAMWPALFRGLEQENRILEAALGNGAARAAGDDPMERHRELARELDRRLDALERGGDAAAIAALRQAIVAAADVQRSVVESSSPGSVPVRRI